MYTDFFKLKALPFQLTPDPRFFYGSKVHNSAMAHLTYGLNQGEGFIIVTGEVGAGKTTLVAYLLSTLDPERYVAAKVVTTQLRADDMLRLVTTSFGIPSEGVDKATLITRFETFLKDTVAAGRRALLLIDEAQNITIDALEELRMLSNIVVDEGAPLQCFLLGQPQFRTIIASPDLDQLRQRVIASYHLGPMSGPETKFYVQHRLELAGWDQDPKLKESAFDQIFEHTDGVPRMINVLCSRLLLYAYLEEVHEIDGDAVDLVAEEYARETRQILEPPSDDDKAAPETPKAVEPPLSNTRQVAPAESEVPMAPEAPLPAEPVSAPAVVSVAEGRPSRTGAKSPVAEYGALEDNIEEVLYRLDEVEAVSLTLERDVKRILRLQREILEQLEEGEGVEATGEDAAAPRRQRRRRRRRPVRNPGEGNRNGENRQRDDG